MPLLWWKDNYGPNFLNIWSTSTFHDPHFSVMHTCLSPYGFQFILTGQSDKSIKARSPLDGLNNVNYKKNYKAWPVSMHVDFFLTAPRVLSWTERLSACLEKNCWHHEKLITVNLWGYMLKQTIQHVHVPWLHAEEANIDKIVIVLKYACIALVTK